MTTALLALEAVLLALLALFVVSLLRSHAEILRRLAAIERGAPAEAPRVSGVEGSTSAGAPDIVGESLAGDAVKVDLGPGSPTTLLAFLSSGCTACGPLWDHLRRGAPIPARVRLLVVTKGPEQESVTALRALAPGGHELLMSAGAWRDFEIPASPHFVLVDGPSGRIAGRGSTSSWERLVTMVEQAMGDAEQGPPARAQTTSERAERAELALAAAGISPGHPSLYPANEGAEEGGDP
jgi:hypothetical protein